MQAVSNVLTKFFDVVVSLDTRFGVKFSDVTYVSAMMNVMRVQRRCFPATLRVRPTPRICRVSVMPAQSWRMSYAASYEHEIILIECLLM